MSNQIKITPFKSKKERKAEIVLENELTTAVLEKIQTELNDALNEFENIEIKLKNIETIDLGFIQYLVSLQSTAASRVKKIIITGDFNDEIKTLLVNTGLYRIFN